MQCCWGYARFLTTLVNSCLHHLVGDELAVTIILSHYIWDKRKLGDSGLRSICFRGFITYAKMRDLVTNVLFGREIRETGRA